MRGLGAILLILLGEKSAMYLKQIVSWIDIPLDTDNEDQLGLVIDVEVTLLAGSTSQADLLTLSIAILLDVGLSALEDDATLLLVGLMRKSSQQEILNDVGVKTIAGSINKVSAPKDG